MAITIIFAVSSSLLLALTVVPVLLKIMEEKNFLNLNNSKNTGFSNEKIYKNYESFLKWSFHKPLEHSFLL